MMPERQSMDIQTAIHRYTKLHLWIYEVISMDIRSYIYGYTKLYLWIYESQSIDI